MLHTLVEVLDKDAEKVVGSVLETRVVCRRGIRREGVGDRWFLEEGQGDLNGEDLQRRFVTVCGHRKHVSRSTEAPSRHVTAHRSEAWKDTDSRSGDSPVHATRVGYP